MISTAGQYVCRFSIANQKDFIFETNFVSLIMVEEAGNYLPTFQFSFTLQNDDVLLYLHEGNKLKISFGRDLSHLYDIEISITKLSTKRTGEARYVSLLGIFAALPYVNESQFVITDSKSSIEAIRERAKIYFSDVVISASSTEDSMRWISPGWSDKKFINEIWMHSNISNSFPAIGISTDGRFIFKDVRAAFMGKPDWKITKDIRDPDKDIAYNDDAEIETNSGFINSWMGYGRKQIIYDLEAGTNEEISSIPEPIIAQTKKIARNAEIEAKYSSSNVKNDNQHANYWQANLNNMTNLAAFSAVTNTLSYSNRYYPMRVLDTVMFKDDDVNGMRTAASEFNSGLYMVTKVIRSIMNRQICTTIVLCREAFNQLR